MDRAERLRLAACVVLGLGAALLMAALLLNIYTVGKVSKIPLNIDTTLISDGRGTALDLNLLNRAEPPEVPGEPRAAAGPRFVENQNVLLRQQQQITTETGPERVNNDDVVTLQVGTTLRQTDMPADAGLMLAMIDTVTMNRTTAEAVDTEGPNGYLAKPRDFNSDAAPEPEGVQHNGLSYRFPVNVSKGSAFSIFDPIAQKTFPANYEGEEDVLGLTTYHFTQAVGLDAQGNLRPEESEGTSITPIAYPSRFNNKVDALITARASEWGLDGVPADELITMVRYYAAHRDFWVDPVSGTIVKQRDQAYHYFVRCDDPNDATCKVRNPMQPARTLVKYSIESTPATVESQLNAARDQRDQIALWGRILPISFTALGIVALVGGALMAFFALRAQTALIDPGLDTADRGFFGPRGPTGEPVPGAEAETEKLSIQRRPPPEAPRSGSPPP